MIGRTAAQADRTAVAGKNDVIVNQLILQTRFKQLSVILDDGLAGTIGNRLFCAYYCGIIRPLCGLREDEV